MDNRIESVAIRRKPEVIERLSRGDLVSDIARHIGCSRQIITRHLAHDPEYQQAFTEALDARLDRADEAIESAEDPLSLARAREQASMARWRAERLNSSKYGQRPTVVNNVINGTLSDAELMRIAAPLLGVSEATGVMSNTIDADSASVLDVEPKAK